MDIFINIADGTADDDDKKFYFFGYCILFLFFNCLFIMTSHINVNTIILFSIISLTQILYIKELIGRNNNFPELLFNIYIGFLIFYMSNIIYSVVKTKKINRNFYYYLIKVAILFVINMILLGYNYDMIMNAKELIFIFIILGGALGILMGISCNIFSEWKNIDISKVKFYEAI